MAFIRTKRVTKNGRTYTYQVRQQSVRVGKKVKSVYLGRVGGMEPAVPQTIHDEYMDKFNAEHPTPYTQAIEKASTEVKALEATPAEAAPPGPSEPTAGGTSAPEGPGPS